MKINVAKVGMEVTDKLTGKVYKITAVEDANATISKAVAEEVLAEDETREPQVITITEEDALTYQVKTWVADDTIYNAAAQAGVLVVDGNPVVMGTIVAKEIFKCFPGTVVFITEPDDKGFGNVVSYDVQRDKFTVLGRIAPNVETIDESDTRLICGFNTMISIDDPEDETHKKKIDVCATTGIYVLTKDKFAYTTIRDNYEYAEDLETGIVDTSYMGVAFDKAVMAQGDEFLYLPIIDGDKAVHYEILSVTNVASVSGSVTVPAEILAVTTNRTASSYAIGHVVITGNGFKRIGSNTLLQVQGIEDYKYLVDANLDRVNHVADYTFANEDRKMKKVVRKMTLDRGDIITVE